MMPMKADSSLKPLIAWGTKHPFEAIKDEFFTTEWMAELKIDGCRAMLEMRTDRCRFGGLRASSFPQFGTIAIPELAGTILDGEFVGPVLPGKDKALLNHSIGLFNSGPMNARKWLMYGPARFIVFDILKLGTKNVTSQPYTQRRFMLEAIVKTILKRYPNCGIEVVPQFPASEDIILRVLADGQEGVILKRCASLYRTGGDKPFRTMDWRKIKRFDSIDAFLTGETVSSDKHPDIIGSVEIAITGTNGMPIIIGHVKVEEQFRAYMNKGVVISVMAQGITENNKLRHPHIVSLRPDKRPADCDEMQLLLLARV
jgi:ATP-dependent DNA ligase